MVSVTIYPIALYSASVEDLQKVGTEDLQKVGHFLEQQAMIFGPRNIA